MKPIDRLRQQYKIFKDWEKDKQVGTIAHFQYSSMQFFCLDCEILSNNDIKLMEFEVNESLK